MTADLKFENLKSEAPAPPQAIGIFKLVVVVDNLLYISGHGPNLPNGSSMVGKVGSEVDIEFGKLAARQTGLTILATLKNHLGSLNRIKRVVKILGMVNSTVDFTAHPQVINGCSALFSDIWGEENGIGVRSAVGMASLPNNISVEIEAVFELN